MFLTSEKLESNYRISPDFANSSSVGGLLSEAPGGHAGEIRDPLQPSMGISRSSSVDAASIASGTLGSAAPTNLTPDTWPFLVRGKLESTDPSNPTRPGCFRDDYLLRGLLPNQEVTVNLNAHVDPADFTRLQFDPYLQLVNADSGQVITYNDDSGSGSSPFHLNSKLTFTVQEGINYIVRVTSFAQGGTGNYTLRLVDWYGEHLSDGGIANLARDLARDGQLSRNDAIAIFRNTKDGGVVDATELTDLRTLVSDRQSLMPDYVHNLSDKIVNGNVANQWYTGGGQTHEALGNLYAGSSADHLEKLIGKWFLGSDRPTADSYTTYQFVNGSLFQNGISIDDVAQGACGDCYYLATLAAAAVDKPALIQNMFIDNGDNTYTVRLYNNGVADYVTVDRYFPTYSSGDRVYASWGGGSYNESDNELWVALAEKAYAQINESGWLGRWDSTNSYSGISGGYEWQALAQISGLTTTTRWSTNDMTQQELIDLVNSDRLLEAGVFTNDYGLVSAHVYAITSYNPSNGTFQFRFHNPWGFSHADLTWEQLMNTAGSIRISWTLS